MVVSVGLCSRAPQTIRQCTGLLLPPELIGAHSGPLTAHSSGRTHALGFRAVTALDAVVATA